MDDDTKDLAKISMDVMLRPITELADDLLGLAGGDWIREMRHRQRSRLHKRTKEILEERGVKSDKDPSPTVLIPLLSAAQDETRDELVEVWAKLIATALDPSRAHLYRREYVQLVQKLEPVDALIVQKIAAGESADSSRIWKVDELVAAIPRATRDQVMVAITNLARLGLSNSTSNLTGTSAFATPLTRQLVAALS